MQKAKLLKGTGILLSEDFPKRIKEKRSQLLKFAKEVSTSSTIFKIFCFYIIHIILLILFILCSVHIFLFLLFLYSIYHKLLQSLKLKTEYGNETQFHEWSFVINNIFVKKCYFMWFLFIIFLFSISSIKIYANALSDNMKTVELEDNIKAIITQI